MPTANRTKEDVDYMMEKEADIRNVKRQKWQTIKEFKANPVEGWCHISYSDRKIIDMAYYVDKVFYWNDMCNNSWRGFNITHVMPIKTPEAPK